ncbi:MAG: hypothetical protein EXR75_14505 [Myxococcales bacterium]|nr:hypothetical protein [Myxococcales bacterium]
MSRRDAWLPLLIASMAIGCASDPDPAAPEPELTTAGAYFAWVTEDASISLMKTLSALDLGTDTLLFCSTYQAQPRSFAEAGELARRPDLPVALELTFASLAIVESSEHQVLWYRSLTDEEIARIP